MKLFLALAFVAVAAALPEPIRLPEPVMPQVAQQKDVQVDKVKFIDTPQSEAQEIPTVDTVKVVHVPLEAVVSQVAEDITADAVKIADAPIETAPVAEEIQADPVKFVEEAKIEEAPKAEEIHVDAVRFVDAPVEQIKIAREPEFVVPSPVVLPSAHMPAQETPFGLKVVNIPQQAPIFFQPAMPLINASPVIVPQQIMDLIMAAEQAQFVAAEQGLPPRIFADPMLR